MFTRALTKPLVAYPDRLTDVQIAMLQRPLRLRGSTRAASDWLPGFVMDPGPDIRQMRRALSAFTSPTHIIWGELDTMTPVADGRDLLQLFPCSTWNLLPRTGHIPGLENPQMLARAVIARLAGPASCRRPARD
jgi:pimeloyl-ACP methyl ester carboxylesterase